jgi:hypothetical protein
MKKGILLSAILVFTAVVSIAQQNIKHARKKGHFSLVYRISADSAEKFLNKYNLFPDQFLDQTPFATFKYDSLELEKLPIGNYIVISANEEELIAFHHCQSSVRLFAINNQKDVQLEVKDKSGALITGATMYINGKVVKYNAATRSFHLPGKKMDEAIVRIETPGDTLFMEMTAQDDLDFNGWQQWWRNFARAKIGRVISWPVRSVKTMITRPASSWFRKKRRTNSNYGYMVFNKPKYLPGDTLRFKAYVLNKKYKRYTGPLDLYFDYYSKGKYEHKKITVLKSTTPGAYVFEKPLGDSLDIDISYTVGLYGKKNRRLMQGSFKMEDYLLKEVATNDLRVAKEKIFKNDTLIFYASAKDANGLAVMDGRLNYYVFAKTINKFHDAKLFVPDTLWKGEMVLQVEGETEIKIPSGNFPNADISLSILTEFRNSNNETETKELSAEFIAQGKYLKAEQDGRILKADLIENGKSVAARGWMYEGGEDEVEVSFPFTKEINPYSENYEFEIKDEKGKTIYYVSHDVESNYRVTLDRIQVNDTAGFALYNPYKIPVHYTVINGNKIIAEGSDSVEQIVWKKILPRNTSFTVLWNYIWAGEERHDDENIAVLDKVLRSEISGSKVIYPGQTDTLTVSITDYKDRPAEDVNLTAVSYNSQFGKDINVKEPPYLQRFRKRQRILIDKYEIEDAYLSKRFKLGDHQGWRKPLRLDTMLFYQLLFPKDSLAKSVQPIADFAPQLAVHIVKKGIPQEIYMLYINRDFAYYNGVTDKAKYAFSVWPGYTQIRVRLKDKIIEIDSIYLQPYYKYDIVFDMDKLPQYSKISDAPGTYTYQERTQIETQVMQLQNDYRTNNGYIWQNNNLVYIGASKAHLIGPFTKSDSVQYYKPGDFDLKFSFENGYEYKLSPKMARLERKSIFYQAYNKPVLLPAVENAKWILGDTIVSPPVIAYIKPVSRPYFKVNDYNYNYGMNVGEFGSLKIEIPVDSAFIYSLLFEKDFDTSYRIRSYNLGDFQRLRTGTYHLVLVTSNFQYVELRNIEIKPQGVNCIKILNPVYTNTNDLVETLPAKYDAEYEKMRPKNNVAEQKNETKTTPRLPVPSGSGIITGKVTDAKGGEPIVAVSIYLKGFSTGTFTQPDGSFILDNIKGGDYILMVNSVGYEGKEIRVHVSEGFGALVNIRLHVNEMRMQEVVVVGYGATRQKKSLAYSVTSIKGRDLTEVLSGKVAGVTIYNDSDYISGNNPRVTLRGNRSISGSSQPLIVLNGVPVPANTLNYLDPKNIKSITTLRGDQASTLYGSDGINGAIIITTNDFVAGSLRENFRDYAFWKPNLFTDKDGKVKFTVTYPDNITSWQTYVVGMDKKRRFTKSRFITKSFKPLMAQLAAPQFLIEGDSSYFIGKAINYSNKAVSMRSDFKIGNSAVATSNKEINANGAFIENLPVLGGGVDTLKAEYTITSSAGFSDGELRKIPVLKKGTEEAKGNFWILENDTSFSFTPDANAGEIKLYAQNNTLDVLLDEIKYLSEYPYYCMEQTASKLTGLLMEKEIRKKLNQNFNGEKEIQKLLKKLQESQLFNGGWAWWQGGQPNIVITNYVIEALLPLRTDVLVETNIRNGLMYLQNNLTGMKRYNLLASLFTMSEAGHYMDYESHLRKLPFDSLTLHQQWQVLKIKQLQNLPFEPELQKLMAKKIETMLGGLHWGADSYNWESNEMATTALAFRFFEKDEKNQQLLKQMVQYFLERRQGGRWRNTVESAKTLEAILPFILKQNSGFTGTTNLTIKGDQAVFVSKFPFSYTVSNTSSPVSITKSGGGLMYFTAWQKIHNAAPQPVNDKFEISSWFERNGNKIEWLKGGEKAVMKIKINVFKDADYVQLEVPIPAGCTYAEKDQKGYQLYSEYFKDKLVLFAESLKAGTHVYEIELEPRYSGTYNLNPVKAELMYFPVFYGRNEMKKAVIKNQQGL